MDFKKLVVDIFSAGLLSERDKSYPNVYYIKHMDNGERINYFGTFRYRLDKKNVLLVGFQIHLGMTGKNVQVRISHIIPYGRGYTKTIFKKGFEMKFKTMLEILQGEPSTVLAEVINKAIGTFNERKSF